MSLYLQRYAWPEQYFFTQEEQLNPTTGVIVVIPCFKEEHLIATLQSLVQSLKPEYHVEVFVVINESEDADEEIKQINEQTLIDFNSWNSSIKESGIRFTAQRIVLPKKHAGVGLARKVGMDDAVRYFEAIGQPEGIILCYDADSLCATNYLEVIANHFERNRKHIGASIHFEHPLEGNLPDANYTAIINYVLFLRYYINALKWAGFPYAHQTIGSSMCVRASTYQKQGGMNRRKAGEDFYFLNKIIPLGGFSTITSTHVIPSPRSSDRVPFGTGKDISDQLDSGTTSYQSYHPQTFIDLKKFLARHKAFFTSTSIDTFPASIRAFLLDQNFDVALKKIRKQSSSENRFSYFFFEWMNAFRILKYVHFCRDNFYPDIAIEDAVSQMFTKWLTIDCPHTMNKKQMLIKLRAFDRSSYQR